LIRKGRVALTGMSYYSLGNKFTQDFAPTVIFWSAPWRATVYAAILSGKWAFHFEVFNGSLFVVYLGSRVAHIHDPFPLSLFFSLFNLKVKPYSK